MKMQDIAKLLAKKTGNEALEDEKSIGFVRFMMYSCVFFCAVYDCAHKGRCANCQAEMIIRQGAATHSELAEEIRSRDNIIRGKK